MEDKNKIEQTPEASFFQKSKQWFLQWRKEYPKLSLGVLIAAGLVLAGILSILLFALSIRFGAFGTLPSVEQLKDINHNVASEVYDSEGQLLGRYFVQNRTEIEYEDISEHIINALIATEDARFFEHKGIDYRSWLRVLFKTVLMGDESSGGGSTISQQLAKNLYPRQRHGFLTIPIVKFKEMYVARRLEKTYSKEELIQLYLNTVPFSGNIFGVEVASRQFFNRPAKDIKPEQAAVLVGMLKATTSYNPVRNPERALNRRNTILGLMAKHGYLSKKAADVLKSQPIELDYRQESHSEGKATYFREYIRTNLADLVKEYTKEDGTPYNLYTDGLRIHTYINGNMQKYAEEAVTTHLSKLQKDFDKHWEGRKPWRDDALIERAKKNSHRYKKLKKQGKSSAQIDASFNKKVKMKIFDWNGDKEVQMSPLDSIRYYFSLLNAGFMVMEPKSGEILAWVGGTNHKYFKYDHVLSKRQVGSTFKPIVYTRAMQSGIGPCDYVDNRLVIYSDYNDWKPENSDGKYGGVYSMAGALTKSVNSVAVDLIMRGGIDSVKLLAQDLGITSDIPAVPAIALGTVDIALYDMIKVYGCFANRGLKTEPKWLKRIETEDGEVLIDFEKEEQLLPERVLEEEHAVMMTKMLQSVVDSGTARRLRFRYNFEGDIAGKTGTTQSHADGWFMGFTPKLVAGAWVGAESPAVRFRDISQGQGANTALPIWAEFMKRVYADPKYRDTARDTFPALSDSLMAMMSCAPYLMERPVPPSEEIAMEEEDTTIEEEIDNAVNILRKKRADARKKRTDRSRKKREANEAKRKEQERIRKHNERVKKERRKNKRKKKRKNFLEKIFKKDK